MENLLPVSGRQLSTTCSNATDVAKRAAPSCNRLQPALDNGVSDRTKASKTVDPIDWLLPPPFTGQYPLSATCMVQMRSQISVVNGTRKRDLRNTRPLHC